MVVVDKISEAKMLAASGVWGRASKEARLAMVKAPDSAIALELASAMRAARGE